MTRRRSRGATLILLLAAAACTDEIPTTDDPDLVPIETETFAVELPFSEFADQYRTFSGFGSAAELPFRYLAHEWEDDLDARTLIRFDTLPATVNARPPDSGTTLPDSMYVPVSGELLIIMDSTEISGPEEILVQAGALLTPWDRSSATWELAVDTLGHASPWPETGGGPVRAVGEVSWAPASTDTIRIEVDSLTVTEWTDPDVAFRGLRLRSATPGTRVRIEGVGLDVRVRPSINPDTLVTINPVSTTSTLIYTPDPEAPPGALQIGGAPAHRATFRIELPESVDPGPAACERVACPVELRPERILYAGIGLYPHQAASPGLAPLDSVPVEMRPVLSPDRLPRSPLGCAVRGCLAPPMALAPNLFDGEADAPVELSFTAYARALLREPQEGTIPPSPTLALLAGATEPATLEPAVFHSPGSDLEPYLRLILTLSEELPLP